MNNTSNEVLIPIVVERDGNHERSYDIYSRLLKDRIIILGTQINDAVANTVIAQLLFLQLDAPEKDIQLYINSPGGSVTAGLAIYDAMQLMATPVATVCMGLAASMGAILLAGGTKGKRRALPHSQIMIHQVLGQIEGQASDIKIAAEHTLRMQVILRKILELHTGQPEEKIIKDMDRNYWLTAQEAKVYGLVDEVFEKGK